MNMGNFNLKINVEDLPGARIMDITVGNRTVTCACIPVDYAKGFCTDAYLTSTGEVKPTKKTTLNFVVHELSEVRYGDTHCVRPALDRTAATKMTEEAVKRHERIVGYMRPWSQKSGGSKGVQPADVKGDGYWG